MKGHTYTPVRKLGQITCLVCRREDLFIAKTGDCGTYEKAVLEQLSHPLIPSVIDHGWLDPKPGVVTRKTASEPALITPHLSGVRLEGNIPLSEQPFIACGRQLSDALSYVHQQNFIHGDVTTLNILQGEVCFHLIDFDMAVRNGQRPRGISIGFSPVEVFLQQVCFRSDVYSLGDSLLRAVRKDKPKESFSTIQVRRKMEQLKTAGSLERGNLRRIVKSFNIDTSETVRNVESTTLDGLPRARELLEAMLELQHYDRPTMEEVHATFASM